MKNCIDVHNEDMLYNWTNRASMSISKADRPFRVAKEMHIGIVQALIDVCSKVGSFIVDLSTSKNMCFSSKNSQSLHQKKSLTIFHLVGNNFKAYQSLRRHIMALE